MDLSTCKSLIKELESDPERLPVYHGDLERAIEWLMDETFKSTDPLEKARLAATELRARGVLERYRLQNVN